MDMLLGDNSLGHKEIKALRRGYSIAAVLSFIVLAFFVFVIVTLWAHFAELYLQTLESIMDGEDGPFPFLAFCGIASQDKEAAATVVISLLLLTYIALQLALTFVVSCRCWIGVLAGIESDTLYAWSTVGIASSGITGMVIQLSLFAVCQKRIRAIEDSGAPDAIVIRPNGERS